MYVDVYKYISIGGMYVDVYKYISIRLRIALAC